MSAAHQNSGRAGLHAHLVQFYGRDTPLLARNVGRYLAEGLRRGDSVVGILTSQNAIAVMQELKRLGVDAGAATRSGRLVIQDAEKTLGQFLVEEWPDADRFHTTIHPLVEAGRAHSGTGICRAYGEMVGVLWQNGKTAAAVHLEQLWNHLLVEAGCCELMCGYPIDVFEDNFDERAIGPILQAHTALISAAPDGDLDRAVDRALEETFGERIGLRRASPENTPRPPTRVPLPEARILALRRENSESAARVIGQAREHYRSERRFRALVENSSDGIAVLDGQGAVVYASPATEKVLGYENDDCRGRNLFDLIHPQHLAAAREIWQKALESPASPVPLETCMMHRDGDWRWIEGVLSNRISDRDIGGVIFNHRDISPRKAAAQLEERLREAAKLESLGILAGGIAHDFNNLLTGILGGASLLLEELPRHSVLYGIAETIVQSGERAAQLTRQMLAYSGRGRFIVEPVDLARQVREIVPLLTASVPKHVRVLLELEDSGAAIEADRGQLQQLVMNVVINAAEAINHEGTVVVRIREVRLEDSKTSPAGDLEPGEYLVLEVQDSGIGMDPATQKRIFEPFFTTKFTGRGLGLAAVLGIVRAHRGAIEVKSKPAEGTTISVFFPLFGHPAPAPAARGAGTRPRASGTVLVVDDEEVVRTAATAALEHHGFHVISCSGGRQAIDQFQHLHSGIALVILDMTMPGLSGEETLELLHTIDASVPVVVSSGYTEEEARRRFGNEIAAFLEKPYTVERVLDVAGGVARQCAAS